MPYCSLEEAWGNDFKHSDYFAKVNQPAQIHSRMPPDVTKEGLENTHTIPKPQENILSYNSGFPSVSQFQTVSSEHTPYKVNFPDRAKRNFLQPPKESNENENDDFDVDILEDNDHDIRHIDKQRRVAPEYEPDYMTSDDYFLYKKYCSLAEKYKKRLRRKFKNFMAEDENKDILESFGNMQNIAQQSYNIKDIFIIIIVGIFIIFALDVFVKLGGRMSK